MRKAIISAVLGFFLFSLALPCLAGVTIKNNTDFRIEILMRGTVKRQSYAINGNEKLTFECSSSGGQLFIYRKQDEVAKCYFEDGDKFVITLDGEKFILKKDKNL
ncbi:MAG: hypothetical protein AB9903_09120 [Vulcanimicrobiota bacterium]